MAPPSASDETPSQRTSGRSKTTNRSRSSLACHNCRVRKVKCDVESLPSGSSCTACTHSKSHCQVNVFSDRRKHGSRQHLASLQNRIVELETLVHQNTRDAQTDSTTSQGNVQHQGETNVTPRPLPGSTSNSMLSSSSLTPTELTMGKAGDLAGPDSQFEESMFGHHVAPGADPEEHSAALGPHAIYDGASPMTIESFSVQRMAPVVRPATQPGSMRNPIEDGDDMITISTTTQQTVDQSSSIMDSRRDAEGAYFGPACPLHVSSPSEMRSLDTPRQKPGVHIDMDSDRLKSVLIETYCRFQRCTVDLVHRPSFLLHRQPGTRSHYYSAFLENSVLACGSRLSTSSAVRSLSFSYAQRAKAEIVSELDDPKISTLQGMLLLSDYEMSEGHDRVGWIYCGIACRLLIDLGLHKGSSSETNSYEDLGDVNHAEQIRRTATAGCLVYESLWSFYLGRPSTISLSGLSLTHPTTASSSGSEHDNVTVRPWLDLCVSLSEITTLINDKAAIDNETIARLSELEQVLRHWHRTLPASVALDEDNITALDSVAYGLHMQYLRVQILLHSLPSSVSSRKRKQHYCESGPGSASSSSPVLHGWTAEASQKVLHHNAVTIIQLAITYREIFGLENTPSIVLDNLFVAATAMISHIRKTQHHSIDKNDVRWLELADEMLEALKIHFYITSRMRRTLACLVEDCPRISYLFSSTQSGTAAGDNLASDAGADTVNSSQQGAWGSYEAVMNDFIFDPDLLTMSAFADVGDLSSA